MVSDPSSASACDISFIDAEWDRNIHEVRQWLLDGLSACTILISGEYLIHSAAKKMMLTWCAC